MPNTHIQSSIVQSKADEEHQVTENPGASKEGLEGEGTSGLISRLSGLIGGALRSAMGREDPLKTPENYDPMEDLYPGRERDLDMVQSSDIGDCYMVAAIYALKHNDVFEGALRKTIKRKDNKDGIAGWEVKFLGDEEKNSVVITPKELDGQKVWNKKKNRSEYRFPIQGGKGDIILERAFGRRRKEINRKKGMIADEKGDETLVVVVGGHGDDFLLFMLGNKLCREINIGREEYNSTLDSKTRDGRSAEELLQEAALNPDHFIITANTPRHLVTPFKKAGKHREFGEGERYFMDAENFFYQRHAYAVTNIDSEKKEVTVVNPHDTGNLKKTISWKRFMQIFSDISAVKLDAKRVKTELQVQLSEWRKPYPSGEERVALRFDHDEEGDRRVFIKMDWKGDVMRAIENDGNISEGTRNVIVHLSKEDLRELKRYYSEKRLTVKFAGGGGEPASLRDRRIKLYEDVIALLDDTEEKKGWKE